MYFRYQILMYDMVQIVFDNDANEEKHQEASEDAD